MSDKRLGGTENSSLRYLSAMRALEVSTSRIVKPSFSRRVRRLFPAGSMSTPPRSCGTSYQNRNVGCVGSRDFLTGESLLRFPNTYYPCAVGGLRGIRASAALQQRALFLL